VHALVAVHKGPACTDPTRDPGSKKDKEKNIFLESGIYIYISPL
jgi:hypothetical protein